MSDKEKDEVQVAETPVATKRVTKTAKAKTELPSFKELDAQNLNEKGEFVGTQVNANTLQRAAEKRSNSVKLGKSITVRTTRPGSMFYFDADTFITERPTVVPDSSWLRLQMQSGKIERVED